MTPRLSWSALSWSACCRLSEPGLQIGDHLDQQAGVVLPARYPARFSVQAESSTTTHNTAPSPATTRSAR
jgi:hypothetical protein